MRAGVSERVRRVEKAATLFTNADGNLRIVAVADTHSKPHPRAAERVRALSPDAILHAGDVGDLEVLSDLERIAPVLAVRGNIDAHAPKLPDVLTIDVQNADGSAIKLLLLHIAVYGPKLRADAAKLARDRGASLVVCGHSHVPFIGTDRGIAVINAGSIGPRRFLLPIVFGLIDVGPCGVKLSHVDCETGARWEPPALPR